MNRPFIFQYNEEENEEDEDDEGRVYDDDEEEDDEDYVHDEGTFYSNHDSANNAQFDRTVSNGRNNEGTVGGSDDNFLHIAKGWQGQGRGVSERKVPNEEVHNSHHRVCVCVIVCVCMYLCECECVCECMCACV